MKMSEIKQTKIESLGEFGLINRVTSHLQSSDPAVITGIGDDAAVIELDKENVQVISSDSLVEGVHFDLSYMPLMHLGFKMASVNISDIAAMNCIPKYLTISLGISSKFSVEAIEEIYKGIQQACDTYGVEVIGGDTTGSLKGLFANITVIGYGKKKEISTRSAAKEKDVICVSGDLGGAYMGMHILEREKKEFESNPEMQPDLEEFAYVVGRQLRPEARTDLVHFFKEMKITPSSMIDISDGLASELLHLSSQSKMKLIVYEEKIPIAEETREASIDFNLDPTVVSLNGGEDYELLFTVSLEEFEKIRNNPSITAIGYVEKGEGAEMVYRSGSREALTAQGWNHFES